MKKFNTLKMIAYIILILYAFISLFPFIWSAMISFTPITYQNEEGIRVGVDFMKWPPKINFFKWPITLFNAPATTANYVEIFKITPYFRWILNTFIYAISVTIGNLFFDSLAGYAFARLKFPFKNQIFSLLLATIMIPFPAIIIPTYLLISDFNLLNSYTGLILPKLTMVFGIFLMRQFFLNIPKELEDAAKIDGASIPKTFFKIILPLSKPALGALGIYTFLNTWNDFMWPLIIMQQKEMFTLTLGLNFFKGSFYTVWPYMMAATMLMTAPMIFIFLSMQDNFIEVGASSGLKG
ncbi:carbohydrate ABC transporter permease [Oceanotoga sp. DSM 15011]|uniref:carbohydrate ABC transporter permease n=1 Tax=Oceanotoga TaxID=1255275 RepID=UPI0021F4C21F|nr:MULTISPECIES: carbohydrate ABC transporter permease [Oceanotoga]MDO7976043.1 carbohydrate ABC transporter permease [Oceanotoga teriensis]UYO98962.1 carbohydrate ABC transporter permease [Oceanotoga sp. DSM 15011]